MIEHIFWFVKGEIGKPASRDADTADSGKRQHQGARGNCPACTTGWRRGSGKGLITGFFEKILVPFEIFIELNL
jgi:hypothetical protein